MQLEHALELWAQWLKNSRINIGMASGSAFSKNGLGCWEELEEEVDNWICEIVDTSVNDLIPLYQSAIFHKYLAEKFRFDYSLFEPSLNQSYQFLKKMLVSRHVILDNDN